MQRIEGKTISNSQVFSQGFSFKSFFKKYYLFFLYFMDNEGLYGVGKEWERSHSKKQQAVGFAGHQRLGLSHESLAKTSPLMTLQISTCASHVTCFTGHKSRVSRKPFLHRFFTKLSHIALTLNPTKILRND